MPTIASAWETPAMGVSFHKSACDRALVASGVLSDHETGNEDEWNARECMSSFVVGLLEMGRSIDARFRRGTSLRCPPEC